MRFTAPSLVSLWALAIGDVLGHMGHHNSNINSNSFASSSTSVAVASNTAAAAVAASSSAAETTNEEASVTCLQADALQTGSDATGAVTESGQSPSATDPANFINFCSGKTLTNGLQVQSGSCNGIPMGRIPSTNNMISTVINFPAGDSSDNIAANTAFTIKLTTSNLAAGVFTNPSTTYYAAPQDLEDSGIIIGHTHVTVQNTGGSLPTTPMNPSTFAFFKGINTAADANGQLTATVTDGLPAGFYRVCTMTSAANHQPVLMPIAQRGAQDDCRYFSVGGVGEDQVSGTGSSDNAKTSLTTSASAAGTVSSDTADTSTTTSSATTSSSSTTENTHMGHHGNCGGRERRGRFMERAYVA